MSGTHRHLAPDRQGLLLTFGIGLTDVVKGQSGMDRQIDFRGSDRAGLALKIARFRPNSAGSTQRINGNTIFTGVCCAFASIA